jgi:hypothetical protein
MFYCEDSGHFGKQTNKLTKEVLISDLGRKVER